MTASVHTIPAQRLKDERRAADFGRQVAKHRIEQVMRRLENLDDPIRVLDDIELIVKGLA